MSKIYKSVFTAQLHTISLALKFQCVVSVTWRRGDKIAEVKEKRQIQKGVATFNEPLELECNMSFDPSTKKFEEKKTRFTILIFSQKGNKQAGQVTFDVAEFLNAKQKSVKIEKTLDKCPDKNAKLNFTLSAYIKEEIQADNISERSKATEGHNMSMLSQSTIQPDFKKKKNDDDGENILSPRMNVKSRGNSVEKTGEQRIPMVNKVAKQKLKLEEENKRLRSQMEELRELQIQNTTLRSRYQEAEKKSLSYYKKKLQEVKKEYNDCKVKAKGVQTLLSKKEALEAEMCQCKEQMGQILNYVMTTGDNDMTEAIYSIYQSGKL